MPGGYKPYTEEQDGRRKLSSATEDAIAAIYQRGGWTKAALARRYKVSPRLIDLIVCPEKRDRARKLTREYVRAHRLKGEEWAAAQRKFRAKKRALGLAFNVERTPKEKEARRMKRLLLKNMIQVSYQGRTAPLKTQMDRLEAAGFCTLCARDLHPHERRPECERTKWRIHTRVRGGRECYFLSEE